ncbi:hypothetical protein CROQUDRAFT_41860 [Cronartium quercuum f. sp. fusiforme G11]|uniref:UspA domain-containing protein n=1 Tax=Cronartium quercuum f. sp. fusiforme G11 TaxID=708437 RepID=A0A9P6TDV2_9BASI|nr:hypothetical protein CROQUDRAFT_41860 [Cronartium quercuum f. sp. fusiforme G11]
MKGIFHKRVPSFSFTTFNWSKDDKDNDRQDSRSQPSTPLRADFDFGLRSTSRRPSVDLDPTQVQPCSPTRPISAVIPSNQPPQVDPEANQPKSSAIQGRRGRSGSLVDAMLKDRSRTKLLDFPSDLRGRRGSANDISLASNIGSASTGNPRNMRRISHQRMRLSSLFGGHRSPPASRSSSPCRSSASARSASIERLCEYESDGKSVADVTPRTAFDQTSDSEEDSNSSVGSSNISEDEDDEVFDYIHDETILANTTANASAITPIDYLQSSDQPVPFIDQAPNLTSPPPTPIPFSSTDIPKGTRNRLVSRKSSMASKSSSLRRKKSTHAPGGHVKLPLVVSRPIYEKNRCTITIEHGDRTRALEKSGRTRFYIVASDLSEDSRYAIEWTIGTVLRQGDECLIITAIETETKFDPDGAASATEKIAKIRNQKDRQEKAAFLVREATSLLERTALNVKVTCQAVHAKHPKHMLVDCIDYLKPSLVIVGRHGKTSAKGTLMGSVCQYLVQKSSIPVMVARRKLRVQPKVYKKKSQLDRTSRMRLDQAAIDKNLQILNVVNQPNQEQTAQAFSIEEAMPSSATQDMIIVPHQEKTQIADNLVGLVKDTTTPLYQTSSSLNLDDQSINQEDIPSA